MDYLGNAEMGAPIKKIEVIRICSVKQNFSLKNVMLYSEFM